MKILVSIWSKGLKRWGVYFENTSFSNKNQDVSDQGKYSKIYVYPPLHVFSPIVDEFDPPQRIETLLRNCFLQNSDVLKIIFCDAHWNVYRVKWKSESWASDDFHLKDDELLICCMQYWLKVCMVKLAKKKQCLRMIDFFSFLRTSPTNHFHFFPLLFQSTKWGSRFQYCLL